MVISKRMIVVEQRLKVHCKRPPEDITTVRFHVKRTDQGSEEFTLLFFNNPQNVFPRNTMPFHVANSQGICHIFWTVGQFWTKMNMILCHISTFSESPNVSDSLKTFDLPQCSAPYLVAIYSFQT